LDSVQAAIDALSLDPAVEEERARAAAEMDTLSAAGDRMTELGYNVSGREWMARVSVLIVALREHRIDQHSENFNEIIDPLILQFLDEEEGDDGDEGRAWEIEQMDTALAVSARMGELGYGGFGLEYRASVNAITSALSRHGIDYHSEIFNVIIDPLINGMLEEEEGGGDGDRAGDGDSDGDRAGDGETD
jgi:hypothetical protein